jgi:hypothetical protein
MAFIDNSGDIILDAVLTDEGRRRLAMGNGSFRITKFALGDDEIDYSLYVPLTASGYEDTRILQLPVFEAFTNNVTSIKNKLLTYDNSNLLYLPVIKVNSKISPTVTTNTGPTGGYYVAVDQPTVTRINSQNVNAAASAGYRFAQAGADAAQTRLIFDQGLDTSDLTLGYLSGQNAQQADVELSETGYLVEVDNRLLQLSTTFGQDAGRTADPSFIDDDNIATYVFMLNPDSEYFAAQNGGGAAGRAQPAFEIISDGNGTRTQNSMIGPTTTTGRLGSRLIFGLRSTLNVQNSQTLFDRLGGSVIIDVSGDGAVDTTFSYINTVVRVTGFSTGYRVEVPLKLLKYNA